MNEPAKPIGVAGLILAGGASSRMGREKAFMPFGGEPLLAHVIARFAPQAGPLAIAANGDAGRFARFGLPVLADELAARCGPLAGIFVGLQFAERFGCAALAVVPSDAPFLPLDLVARLAWARRPNEVAAATTPAGPEPLFSLWPIIAKARVAEALAAGRYGVLSLIEGMDNRLVSFAASEPNPFFNLNRAEDVETARQWIDGGRSSIKDGDR